MRTTIALVVAVCGWSAAAWHSTLAAQQPTAQALVAGVYTEEQAKRGEAVYKANCELCHGTEAKGDLGPPLTRTTLMANWKAQTLADLYLKITTMPTQITPEQRADVLAYVLQVDKFPPGSAELTSSEEALRQIRIDAPQP